MSKLAVNVRGRIQAKIDAYALTGRGDVKALKGHPGARLRVGSWRVIFIEDSAQISVLAVGHRREIYDCEAT